MNCSMYKIITMSTVTIAIIILMAISCAQCKPTETELQTTARSRSARAAFSHLPFVESSEGGGKGHGPLPAMEDGRLKFVPLKDFVARAKGDPMLIGIMKKALQRIGFDGDEVLKLFETGKSTFKGTDVTIDDVSKFCCPLGV